MKTIDLKARSKSLEKKAGKGKLSAEEFIELCAIYAILHRTDEDQIREYADWSSSLDAIHYGSAV